MTKGFAANILEARTSDGRYVVAPVVNDHVVRVAAGTTMVIGAIAFSFAYFEKRYWPLQVVAVFFFIEFLVRVSAGISRSPVGLLTGWMTQRQQPDWVSAKPKRFAWTLGLAMSGFDGFHHELRHTRLAAEVYLPGLSGSHVARIGARALLGL